MKSKSDKINDLYNKETDIRIISFLYPYLENKNFIDIGAEKGGFANALLKIGFSSGILVEPMPAHLEILESRFKNENIKILSYAIDNIDRDAEFNVACDETGEELDYFHSLNKIESNNFFKHNKTINVRCKSLESLMHNGDIFSECGVLKIDTEGNDLKVIQGIGKLRPEIIICEYVPPSLYPDWSLSFAKNLVPEVKKLGYSNLLAAQRTYGVNGEKIILDPDRFTDDDWGNLIFIRNDVFARSKEKLERLICAHARKVVLSENIKVTHSDQYGKSFSQWIESQIRNINSEKINSVAIDVGAYKGEFFKAFVDKGLLSEVILFEPNPLNYQNLLETHRADSRYKTESLAVGAYSHKTKFNYGEDGATGSLIPPINQTPPTQHQNSVQVITIDDYVEINKIRNHVSIIKIDTQGCDLDVLIGAEKTIQLNLPIVVVEMIYAPLYENQCSPVEIFNWFNKNEYSLVGLFDEHFSADGWLAWCDACFLPNKLMESYSLPFDIRKSLNKDCT
jgi:FkbM family methyltransferase